MLTVHVNEITEKDYELHIDVPEEQEDALYDKLSCQACMDDIFDVESFLEEEGVSYEKYAGKSDSRIETWR